ncbi:hypothetical protein [Francisella tularensis]|uniref:hypothetical protein n=1 Tax=Francisella tularensis TaxID=263 RepID=UPI001747E933|nr:hypothetical protein [Francisella tularensis subsp. holarctica]
MKILLYLPLGCAKCNCSGARIITSNPENKIDYIKGYKTHPISTTTKNIMLNILILA